MSEEEKQFLKRLAGSADGKMLSQILKKYCDTLADARTFGTFDGDGQDPGQTFRARLQAITVIKEIDKQLRNPNLPHYTKGNEYI